MMKFCAAMITLFSTLSLTAQVVNEALYGEASCYDEGVALVELTDGYLLSAAKKCGSADWKGNLLQLDANLDTTKVMFDQAFHGRMASTAANGNILFYGGEKAGFVNDSIRLTKTTATGQVLWSKSLFYGLCKNTSTKVTETADGHFLITGFYAVTSCSNPSYDAFVTKMTTNGDVVWEYLMEGYGNDQLHGVVEMSNGMIAASGWSDTKTRSGDVDYTVQLLNADGTLAISRTFGEQGYDFAYDITALPNNELLLTGHSDSLKLVKLDSVGTEIWTKTYGRTCGSANYKAITTHDNGLVVLGTESVDGTCTALLIKMDYDGVPLWRKNLEGRLRQVIETKTGNLVLTGYRDYLPQAVVIEFDSTRFELPTEPIDTTVDSTANPNGGVDTVSTSIWEVAEELSVSAYPNPAINQITISWTGTDTPEAIYLIDLKGSIVRNYSNTTGSELSIPRNDLPTGIYAYRVQWKHKALTRKVIFQ